MTPPPIVHGWLVTNHFICHPKFTEHNQLLVEAAARSGLALSVVTNQEAILLLKDLRTRPDIVVFWDKDTTVARLIESHNIRVCNTGAAIELCDDKTLTYAALLAAGVPQPHTLVIPHRFRPVDLDASGFAEAAIAQLGLPLVAKEAFGSFGEQVRLLHTEKDLTVWLTQLGTRKGLLQQYIAAARGSDVRIQMAGHTAVAAMRRTAAAGDFRANMTNGGTAEPFIPTAEQLSIARTAMDTLGLDFAGIDFLPGEDGRWLLCEVNSNAHLKNLGDVTGIDVAGEVMAHVARLAGLR